MKILAVFASVAVLVAYRALMQADPRWQYFEPRGGMAMLAFSLLLANLAIWMGARGHRPLSERFQWVVAGWIWILVQMFGTLYAIAHAGSA